MTARVCVVTAGHLATCPRMLKAADALAGAGYRVRVVSGRRVAWATAADDEVRDRRAGRWEWTVVDGDRRSAPWSYVWGGARYRASRAIARGLGRARVPLALAARAYARAHAELLRAALQEPADLYYGGTTGALAAVAVAARRAGVPYALDLEDFHSGESDDPAGASLVHALARGIERAILPGAAFLTASSAPIAQAYAETYGVRPVLVHNTFGLPVETPDVVPTTGEDLKLYWFGQTIGPGRGLEDAVRAVGLAGISAELHLRGLAAPGYLDSLGRLGTDAAPRLKIIHHEPAPPDRMVELCRGYDVGLALEQGHVPNRAWCLTNKAFTYILAALAVAFTDTPGQRTLALDLAEGAILYPPGDVAALAAGLLRWEAHRGLLLRAKAAAWEAARRRWHWEHPDERGALLCAVAGALGSRSPCA